MTQGYLSGPVIKRTLIKKGRGRLVTRGGGHVTTSAGGMLLLPDRERQGGNPMQVSWGKWDLVQ